MKALINGKIYTITEGILDRGTIIIDDGQIIEVGEQVEVPAEAQQIDCSGQIIMPGLIDAHTHVGIGEQSIGWEGQDYNEVTEPITPHLRAIDGINPYDQGFEDARQGGITTVMTGPGSANVIGGQNVVLKTHGRTVEEMILRQPAGMKCALGENPKRAHGKDKGRSPQTRMASAALLRQALIEAEDYRNKRESAEDKPDRDLKKEALVRVLAGEIPLRIHAHRADDIMTALRIGEEFGISITLEHCTEGHKIAQEIAKAGVPAVIGPSLTSRSKVELRERTFETLAVLYEAGVTVALMTDHPVIPLQYLPIAAALAVKAGLPYEQALRALTINPARILGVDDRVGSLEVGKDADIVVFTGDPLEIMSRVVRVFISGEPVYDAD